MSSIIAVIQRIIQTLQQSSFYSLLIILLTQENIYH